jgi:methyl-accepting chemotaxis protein
MNPSYQNSQKEFVMNQEKTSIWNSIILFFIPNRILINNTNYRKTRIIIYIALFAAFFMLISALKWFKLDAGHIGYGNIITALVISISLFFLKANANIRIVGNVVTGSLLTFFWYLAYQTGGLNSINLIWCVVAGMFAFLLLPSVDAILWFIGTFIFMIILIIFEKIGVSIPTLNLTEKDIFTQKIAGVLLPAVSVLIASWVFQHEGSAAVQDQENMTKQAGEEKQKVMSLIHEVDQHSTTLDDSSEVLLQNSNDMEIHINQTSNKVTELFKLTQTVTDEIKVVGEETETSTNRMMNIADNTEQISGVIDTSIQQTTLISEVLSSLNKQGQDIGNITNHIRSIANQTKMLSLNASIEAVKTEGEGGKGFTVLAGQMKALAEKTAELVRNIDNTVSEFQTSSESANQNVHNIQEIIQKISSLQQKINESVKEQNQSENLIKERLATAVSRVILISQGAEEILEISEKNKLEAQATQSAASTVDKLSEQLRFLVNHGNSKNPAAN